MAGTDPYEEKTISPDLAWRKAVARLRTLLVSSRQSEVHLVTRQWKYSHDERWLSDRYTLVNVTGDVALTPEAFSAQDGSGSPKWPDGTYKLTAGKGLIPHEFLPSNTEKLLDELEKREGWLQVHRTQWSVADSTHKLMLVYADLGNGTMMGGPRARIPGAINEGIWTAFVDAFWDKLVTFERLPDDGYPFRVKADDQVVGYVARGVLPEDEIEAAMRLLGTSEPPDPSGKPSWWDQNIYGTEAGE